MALGSLIANILMKGSQKDPESGKSNWATGQFWGNIGKSMIPQGGGQVINQLSSKQTPIGNQTLAGNLPLTKECPDPNGVHGKGIMMNLTLMYGKPMYLCPSCAYMEQG